MVEAKSATGNGKAEGAPTQSKRPGITRGLGYLRRSRSVRLIEALLATGKIECDRLACALRITQGAVESYRRGRARMPLEHQLSLALLVIERWPFTPQLRRSAYALRSQVLAEAALHARITKTHAALKVAAWVRGADRR